MKHRILVTGSRVSAFALAALLGTIGLAHAGQAPSAAAPGYRRIRKFAASWSSGSTPTSKASGSSWASSSRRDAES